jgi:hypothetical protein
LFNNWTIGHETTRLCRNAEYRLPSNTTQSSTVTDGPNEGVLLWESRNCKMQDITEFCSDRFSDPHRYVRSILQCEQTGYGAGSSVCGLLK